MLESLVLDVTADCKTYGLALMLFTKLLRPLCNLVIDDESVLIDAVRNNDALVGNGRKILASFDIIRARRDYLR